MITVGCQIGRGRAEDFTLNGFGVGHIFAVFEQQIAIFIIDVNGVCDAIIGTGTDVLE